MSHMSHLGSSLSPSILIVALLCLHAKGDDVKIEIYGKEIEKVDEFKYLGRIFTRDDDDSRAIGNQIARAREKWNSVAKILKQDGADPPTMEKSTEQSSRRCCCTGRSHGR